MSDVRIVHPADRSVATPATPGMDRRQAFHDPGAWVGHVTTAAGVVTGWHTHADYDTFIYVLRGHVTIEFGPAGSRAVAAGPGDFVRIGRGVVHREGTAAGSAGVDVVLVRVGQGEPVTNVDGPDPA
ncbi:MAG: cupin domain-containing protein [Candidatus Limnocylindrales bacterium]